MKGNLLVFVCFSVITTNVNALKCYICDSGLHGSSCYDPIDTSYIDYMKCEDVFRRQRITDGSATESKVETFDFQPPEKLQGSWNPNVNYDWNQYPTEFECVQYEIIYGRTNRREFVRKCQGRNQIPNFCNALQEQGYRNGYSLAKCDVCTSDYCNSSIKIKISLLLNFLFFLVFYRCTS